MPDLLLIDAALGALLIFLAGWVIMGHRRRQRERTSVGAEEQPGTATDLAAEGTAGHERAVGPGFGDDPSADLNGSAPAEPEQAAAPRASGTASAVPDSDGLRAQQHRWAQRDRRAQLNRRAQRDRPQANANGTEPDAPRAEPDAPRAEPDAPRSEPDAPQAERDAPQAEPEPGEATGAAHDPDGPETEPDAQRAAPNGQAAAGDATVSDRIGSYYDEADRTMSDYLAAMGWAEEPETRRTG
jgi:hypothetical protein